ncbi:hypothetical protein TNCV_4746351 [Trichonephila clavipes]|nr:hypothetical protein TNCV_4746351 [Trichonephila clavipes]
MQSSPNMLSDHSLPATKKQKRPTPAKMMPEGNERPLRGLITIQKLLRKPFSSSSRVVPDSIWRGCLSGTFFVGLFRTPRKRNGVVSVRLYPCVSHDIGHVDDTFYRANDQWNRLLSIVN